MDVTEDGTWVSVRTKTPRIMHRALLSASEAKKTSLKEVIDQAVATLNDEGIKLVLRPLDSNEADSASPKGAKKRRRKGASKK